MMLVTSDLLLGNAGIMRNESICMQAEKKAFEENAKARATANSSSRYGQQEVCQISGLIINSEETRVRDHKMGRNYRCEY